MSRNARSRRYKQRHGISPGHGPMRLWVKPCNQCFGAIHNIVNDLPAPQFEVKLLGATGAMSGKTYFDGNHPA